MAIMAGASRSDSEFGPISRPIRRAAVASTLCSLLEWYDVALSALLSGMVFTRLYFPQSSPLAETMQTILFVATGFVARPLGAVVFGHFGDRVGRKPALIVTLLLMGFASLVMGLLPTYETIGILGALILGTLRIVQGVAVGGGWGGSVLLSMEWAEHKGQRGLLAAWPQIGVPAGFVLAYAAVFFFKEISGDQFLVWGWRIPCLLSVLLVALAGYMKFSVRETPVFAREVARWTAPLRAPIIEAIQRHPREIILTALVRMGELVSFSVFTGFVFVYARETVPWHSLITAVLAGCVIAVLVIPLSGRLSDRIDRASMYMVGATLAGAYGFIYFGLFSTLSPALILLSLIPYGLMVGPQAAMIAERFDANVRYSGASLGYQLGAVIVATPAQFVVGALFAHYKSGYAVAALILACSIVSAIAAFLLQNTASAARQGRVKEWLGGRGRNAVREGKDEAEVMAKGAEHAKAVRNRMTIPPSIRRRVMDAIRGLPKGASGSKRNLNAWIDSPTPSVGRPFRVWVNIGEPQQSAAASARFTEPDWHNATFIDLVISLSSLQCDIEPNWQELVLPRAGVSDTIRFDVVANADGEHQFSIKVYLAKQMILLQSLSFVVRATASETESARAYA